MNKGIMRYLIVTLAVLIAYNFAVFMIPCLKTPTFWVSWGFTLLSFAISGYAIYISLLRNTDAKSRFYGFPIARIAVVYLALQVATGGVCMALGHIVPWWAAAVLSAILLALAAIGLISAESVVDEIQNQDAQLKKDVSTMRSLQSKVNQMAAQFDDTALTKLAEEFRYSDPVSREAIAEAEADLTAVIDELQSALTDGECEAALQLTKKASLLLAERNRLCKLNK